ncbi:MULTISPECIES: NAD(P)/FAD-dependent oxidoreductase [unclassified Streptomyces]|uniref:phytoene desaturase family protein n=1 Tax=unclassified Streptomyces TaxID=2593676 RepID=UPI0001C19959|nr:MULTISPECIES: NAD(P)/FAD-dependent oxidoreductase [unclassified Streptomyces]MYR68027.1 FAD-dependent oxidoreductase [Streptomyces sp. SID4939]MYS00005.1 FAD-dependent oxidoreductase [Streptomyces sp. SID4940]MYT67128.1 FAD-dependent oxidoreductase [Streptomyces sp. SID8357]MYT84772.1 FAD-dependent oxidoreductase [Streptomyces sp. SID8360]MYW40876.1 FAD-dependent oxidoreductase [Streptomyces sp. SID1]MYX73276.1 FAD-dependent oxidoreductase [Streptomyces sp. SID3915]
MPSMLDAVVVGAGPNGLTAAVELARRGFAVEVFEAKETVGGGSRTEELTLPGFRHDPCSAVHPLGIGSPAFDAMPLARHGLAWLQPELALAHPFPDGSAAVLTRSVGESAMSLGAQDAGAYRRTVAPYVGHWDTLAEDFLRTPWDGLPRDPYRWMRFGVDALPPATLLARRFRGAKARGLIAGLAAHAIAPTSGIATSGIALLFALAAHEKGWPVPRGGSQAISDALASYLREQGGTIRTGTEVRRLDELPPARAYIFDTSPTALARIAGLGSAYRGYRYGASCFKIDYALSGPVPWTAEEARRAGTVHIGPTAGEIDSALHAAVEGRDPSVPFLITAQPSVVDPSRAPEGRHVFWVYGHVPAGWEGDATEVIERQLERFAPGFRDLVLARATAGPPQLAARNANYVGGDIASGAFAGLQTVIRPKLARVPYATAHPAVFLCSSATPPGPGVHGMSGHHAAKAVWRRLRAT